MPRLRVIVSPVGRRVVMVLDEAGRLIFYTTTFSRKLKAGEYSDPRDVVNVFMSLATRGHRDRSLHNPDLLYRFLEAILLSDTPMQDKREHVIRYLRSAKS